MMLQILRLSLFPAPVSRTALSRTAVFHSAVFRATFFHTIFSRTALALLTLVIAGCSKPDAGNDQQAPTPWVKTVGVATDGPAEVNLSGTLRAKTETPIAFQVGGRILARHVQAGQQVKAGQLLFSLDPRDLHAAEQVAAAQLAAAEAALATARSELERQRQLVQQEFVSPQALERFELAERNAASQRDAAKASLSQTRNALAYAKLKAEQAGVLIEVNGEPGQVVGPGQAIGLLAWEGERDVEVFLADGAQVPREGKILLGNGASARLELREVAGAADALSRTWRARYQVRDPAIELPLGMVVQVVLEAATTQVDSLVVPLGALDERSEGPRIWLVDDQRATPVAVEVLALDAEHARIRASLPADARIIALGTHLLTPGMAVRELGQ